MQFKVKLEVVSAVASRLCDCENVHQHRETLSAFTTFSRCFYTASVWVEVVTFTRLSLLPVQLRAREVEKWREK